MQADVIDATEAGAPERSAKLNAALVANDRLTFYCCLLQTARAHTEEPDQPPISLKRERQACGLTDDGLDKAVAGATKTPGGYHVSGCQHILRAIADNLTIMAEPAASEFRERAVKLLAALPSAIDDVIASGTIDAIVAPGGKGHDSVQLLATDLRKALQADLAQECVGGASTYNTSPADRLLVGAFMRGLNRTSPLKFTHAGLGATATRIGERLVIQGNLGTTDAPALIIRVKDNTVCVTCSDIHLERLQFFQSLFENRGITWSGPESRTIAALVEGVPFQLSVGHYVAADAQDLEDFLNFLGSRLVFVIDWNKARRQLNGLIKRQYRVDLLRWSADNDIGHCGFLEMGGARLVNRAVEANTGSVVHAGDRLYDKLGDEPTDRFLRFCFRTATEGLLAHHSHRSIRDRVQTELKVHLASGERRLLEIAIDHADLILQSAVTVHEGLIALAEDTIGFKRMTKRARQRESAANQLVNEARQIVRRRPEDAPYDRIIAKADEAANELESIVFLLGLFRKSPRLQEILEPLRQLADIVVSAAMEWIKVVTKAGGLKPSGTQQNTDDFVTAVNRIDTLAREAVTALRRVVRAAGPHAKVFSQIHLVTSIGKALEKSSDALDHASVMLRDQVLGGVSAPGEPSPDVGR